MRLLALLVLFAILPSTVFAQTPPISTFPPGDDKIVPLKQGDPAPFSGQLFETNTAMRWGNWLQQYKLRLVFDVDTQKKVDQAQADFLQKELDIERKQYVTVTTDYQKKVTELEKQLAAAKPWYTTQTFAFIMGGVCTATVFGLSVWALEARK